MTIYEDYLTVAGYLTVNDEVYGIGWNGSNKVPTQNALYDKIETLSAGGSDGYISNVTESGNNITFTGVGSAFSGSIGSVAKTDVANVYSALPQKFGSSSTECTKIYDYRAYISGTTTNAPVLYFQASGTGIQGSIKCNINSNLTVDAFNDLILDGENRKMTINTTGIFGELDAATTTDVVYYNSSTDELTYGAASTGHWLEGSGFIAPATLSNEVRIGSSIDNGSYMFQVHGHSYFNNSVTIGEYVQASNFVLSSDKRLKPKLSDIQNWGVLLISGCIFSLHFQENSKLEELIRICFAI